MNTYKNEYPGMRVRLLTKCLKCLVTISCKASVALVVSRVTIGFRVIIVLTGVDRGSKPSAVTFGILLSKSLFILKN